MVKLYKFFRVLENNIDLSWFTTGVNLGQETENEELQSINLMTMIKEKVQ